MLLDILAVGNPNASGPLLRYQQGGIFASKLANLMPTITRVIASAYRAQLIAIKMVKGREQRVAFKKGLGEILGCSFGTPLTGKRKTSAALAGG
jgi:hypothetical protein